MRRFVAGDAPEALRLRAVWSLIWSEEPEEIARAARLFEQVAALEPASERASCDLAGARLLSGFAGGDPVTVLRSVESAIAAQELAPGSRCRAATLALDALGLRELRAADGSGGAPGAWQLARETLLREATIGDDELDRLLDDGYAQAVREFAEQEGLGAWGTAILDGDLERAARWQEALERLGEAVFVRNGEAVLREAAEQIGRLPAERRSAAANGYVEFADGLGALFGNRFTEARDHLVDAERWLGSLGSPVTDWCAHYLGVAEAYAGDLGRAERIQARIAAGAEGRAGRRALAGRAHWSRGTDLALLGRPWEAIEPLRRAVELFRMTEEPENEALSRLQLSLVLSEVGRRVEGVEELAASSRLGRHIVRPARRHNILLTWSDLAGELELPRTGDWLFDALEESARALGSPLARLEVDQNRCRAANAARAAAICGRALEEAGELEEPGLRADAVASISLDLARKLVEADPKSAESAATTAHEHFRTTGLLWEIDALVARARARIALGDSRGAGDDLGSAFSALAERRGEVEGVENRELTTQRLTELGVATVQLARSREMAAPELWRLVAEQRERSRGVGATGPRRDALSLKAIESRLAPGEAVLEFSVLPDETLVWLIRRSGTEFDAIPWTRTVLRDAVRGLNRALVGELPGRAVLAAKLSSTMFGLVARRIGEIESMVVVPDDALFELPLNALPVPGQEVPLAGRLRVALSYSSTGSVRAAVDAHGREPIRDGLVVADPAFGHDRFPRLERLPSSRDEAARVAALLGNATVLLGEAATPDRVLAGLTGSNGLLFLAAHSLSGRAGSGKAGLVLAPSEESPEGVLWSDAIREARLRTAIVILAGCRTAEAPSEARQPMVSLARSFAEAGADAVLGTLWDLDDAESGPVLESLVRGLTAGESLSEAVRREVATRWTAGVGPPKVVSSLQVYEAVPFEPDSSRRR